jgi:hypothetical protein
MVDGLRTAQGGRKSLMSHGLAIILLVGNQLVTVGPLRFERRRLSVCDRVTAFQRASGLRP